MVVGNLFTTCRKCPVLGKITGSPRQVYAFRNVILDPVAIPPFLRVDLYAIKLHGEMDVVAPGHSRLPTRPHHLAAKGCRECVLGN